MMIDEIIPFDYRIIFASSRVFSSQKENHEDILVNVINFIDLWDFFEEKKLLFDLR